MIENPKAFMTEEEIQQEDDSIVTIYKPEKCYNGYSIFSFEKGPPESRIVDMNGRLVNRWQGKVERSKYLENSLLLKVGGTAQQILEFDWEGKLVWEFLSPGIVHHDATRLAGGNTVFLYREAVPKTRRQQSSDPERRDVQLMSDAIMEVTPDKEVVFDWHQYEHFDIDWYKPHRRLHPDWTHSNTINCIPDNRWFEAGDKRFTPGNYLVSMRSLDTIVIVSRETGEITWKYSGDYRGGLSGQHEPNMVGPDLPGAGNILIFDNGVEEAHTRSSIVLELNPVRLELEWKYEHEDFFSGYRSTVERLPNGNTFINEADHKRMLEVTPDCEIVWEYWIPETWRAGRSHRVPYDYGTKLKSLPLPIQTPVDSPLTKARDLPVY